MSDHISIERIHEAIDGLLPSAETDALEVHLGDCPACRNDYARLSEVVGAVRVLPRSAAPPADAWDGIAARIQETEREADSAEAKVLQLPTQGGASAAEAGGDLRHVRFSLTMPQLAAAAFLVAVLSAMTMWVALGETPVGVASSVVDIPGGAAARAVSLDGGGYVEVVDQLERILEEGRTMLGTETLVTIEESLRTVDAAIEDVEVALAEDPNSDLLLRMLASQRRMKLGVLQRAASAVQAQT